MLDGLLRPRQAVFACLGGYLYGSVPFVDRLARRRNVDLAASGSGNVGGANLWAATGTAYGVLGWILDASKGLAPIAACRRLGYDEEIAALAGVCGVAGQCWPLFLRLNGGRGISAFVGAGFLIDRRCWSLSLLPLIAGGLWRVAPLSGRRSRLTGGRLRASRSRSVPFGCFLGIITFPLACYARGRAVRPSLLLAALLLLRRLSAPLPDDAVHGPRVHPQALAFRLLFDRNTSR
ncbi:MAG TPA: glycerol-3-phosphate acyltransferase [Chloroflexota bacterium]|nr:glycerol-3-phosphate acyltransferase [Chloroflexota bacterium]